MERKEWVRVHTLVSEALKIAPSKRQKFIRESCDDGRLMEEVKKQLHFINKSEKEGFLENLGTEKGDFVNDLGRQWKHSSNSEELIGSKIGPYEIIELLDSGGMGAVFKANRVDGSFHQTVAIKLIKQDVVSEELIRRFKQEQEILASLKHPNIAQLFDGGVTSDGIPYLIMEFVEGEPIDIWCDIKQCTLKRRLELFQNVCEAIQYAHQKMIVHRDIKPQNILVSNTGRVKVLDFGIAKILQPAHPGQSVMKTAVNQRYLTPQFAAPEQITGGNIGVATDVYALGALLYRLLRGTYPFDFAGKSTYAIESIIINEDPVAPGKSAMDAEKKTLVHRGLKSCKQFQKLIRGDLDAITLKALRKEPKVRYNSVERLEEDIANYLHNRPVAAREKAVRYRMKKYMQRHRWGVGAAIILMILLTGGVSATLWQARVAAKERDNARLESEKSKAVAQYLTKLFEANNPAIAQGDTITVREVLERGLIRIQALQGQPVLQATLFSTTGQIYHNIGKLKKSEDLYRRASEIWKMQNSNREFNLEWAQALFGLARTLAAQGRNKEAVPILRKVIEIDLPENATFHLKALVYNLNNLHVLGKKGTADTVFTMLNTMLAKTTIKPDVETALLMVRLSQNFGIRGKMYNKVEYIHRGQTLVKRALATFKEQLGTKHPIVGEALMRMAVLYKKEHKVQPNEQLLITADSISRKALHIFQSVSSKPNAQTYMALLYRSQILKEMGRYDNAKKLLVEGLHMLDSLKIKGSRSTLVFEELADIAFIEGNYEAALKRSKQAKKNWVQKFGKEYVLTLVVDLDIAKALIQMKRYPAAETRLLATYNIFAETRGREDQFTRRAASKLVALYEAWNKPKLAAAYRDTLDAMKQI